MLPTGLVPSDLPHGECKRLSMKPSLRSPSSCQKPLAPGLVLGTSDLDAPGRPAPPVLGEGQHNHNMCPTGSGRLSHTSLLEEVAATTAEEIKHAARQGSQNILEEKARAVAHDSKEILNGKVPFPFGPQSLRAQLQSHGAAILADMKAKPTSQKQMDPRSKSLRERPVGNGNGKGRLQSVVQQQVAAATCCERLAVPATPARSPQAARVHSRPAADKPVGADRSQEQAEKSVPVSNDTGICESGMNKICLQKSGSGADFIGDMPLQTWLPSQSPLGTFFDKSQPLKIAAISDVLRSYVGPPIQARPIINLSTALSMESHEVQEVDGANFRAISSL
eukprot:TRINITY_DN32529_c0_g1_i1.p1 TRINITY_DN32529_c0_g1~~TRINITY_DN32529_c0_g1_i1.p1  ORF type:complete len:336 (+),score=64.36 TRINITY_DN32529_c0_g1_i1:162-1169(+)